MSALDPTAAALLAAVNAADTALLETVLDLGVSAQVLQAQISVGDQLPALVLKPQNGTDAIEIGGKRVAAQLPPDVRPGQTLVLQVVAFDGNRIIVRNLGTAEPQNAPPPLVLTPQQAPTPQHQSSQAAQQSQQPQRSGAPSVATPHAVFVAASVRASQSTPAAPAQTTASTTPPQPQHAAPATPGVLDAKIAAAQTPRSVVAPPVHSARAASQVPPIATGIARAQTTSDVLRAARLPDTAFTRTVAAVAHQAPQRLAQVFARLDQVLARIAGDSRAATLRTLAAFTGRMNLANSETLPAQIAAYVSHVIEGAETKVATLLQAYRIAAPAPEERTGSPLPGHAAAPVLHASTLQQGRIAHHTGEIEHDLKTLILSLIKDPPAGRTPAIAQALNESLITVTATQLNVLSANIEQPNAITLPLPAFFYEGGKPAHLRIARDEKRSRGGLDADNFHVAFVLDTKHLGTVSVDVQTASRNVKIDVKAEHTRAASAFSGTLNSLKARLESLRYRVSSASAQVAQQVARDTARTPARRKDRAGAQLDLHA